MASISGQVFICRPIEDVFDFVADERNNYDPSVFQTDLLTNGHIGVGTRFRSMSTNRGKTVEMIVEITEFKRPRRLGSSTHLGSMDIHSALVFEPTAEGTLMQWSSVIKPRGLLNLLSPLIALYGRRQISAIWANLKQTLEAAKEGIYE